MTDQEISRIIEGVATRLEPFAESFVKNHVDAFMHQLVGDNYGAIRARVQLEIREAVCKVIDETVSVQICIKP